jgi:hypothetical protein
MDKREEPRDLSPRWIATLKIRRRCPLANHNNIRAHF